MSASWFQLFTHGNEDHRRLRGTAALDASPPLLTLAKGGVLGVQVGNQDGLLILATSHKEAVEAHVPTASFRAVVLVDGATRHDGFWLVEPPVLDAMHPAAEAYDPVLLEDRVSDAPPLFVLELEHARVLVAGGPLLLAFKELGAPGMVLGRRLRVEPAPTPEDDRQRALSEEMASAIRDGSGRRVTQLLSQGADIDRRLRFGGRTPLHEAASEDRVDLVGLLLQSGADPNVQRVEDHDPDKPFGTPMIDLAGRTDRQHIARMLLHAGTEVDAVDFYDRTALHFAVRDAARIALVRGLLEAGADPNHRDEDGGTPLCCASDVEVVQTLLDAGADPDIPGWNGRTALIRFASAGDLACVQALVAAGADSGVHDASGRTAADHAVADGHRAVAQWLLDRGAAVSSAAREVVGAEGARTVDAQVDAVIRWLGSAAVEPVDDVLELAIELRHDGGVELAQVPAGVVDTDATPAPLPAFGDLPGPAALWVAAELLRRADEVERAVGAGPLHILMLPDVYSAARASALHRVIRGALVDLDVEAIARAAFADPDARAAFLEIARSQPEAGFGFDTLADALVIDGVAGALEAGVEGTVEGIKLSMPMFESLLPSHLLLTVDGEHQSIELRQPDSPVPVHVDFVDDVDVWLPPLRERFGVDEDALGWGDTTELPQVLLRHELIRAAHGIAAGLREHGVDVAPSCAPCVGDYDDDDGDLPGQWRIVARRVRKVLVEPTLRAEFAAIVFDDPGRRQRLIDLVREG